MCEVSLNKMGTVFDDSNVYMLHMQYQAMGVCLFMGDWDGATRYGEKIVQPYRYSLLEQWLSTFFMSRSTIPYQGHIPPFW